MTRLTMLLTTAAAVGLVGGAGAAPQHDRHRDAPPAGYTLYTSHGTILRGEPVHDWQTYDDRCDLPSEGCDDNHRVGIGG